MKIKMWDDPFEGFLFNRWSDKNNSKEFEGLSTNLFCVCLSEEREKDQFWRSYTPNMDGVRIKINIKELSNYLKGKFYLGEIPYKNIPDIKSIIKEIDEKKFSTTEELMELFLFKRLAFQHDKEVRLLNPDFGSTDDVKKVDFDPYKVVNNLMFDPRMNTHRKHLKITCVPI